VRQGRWAGGLTYEVSKTVRCAADAASARGDGRAHFRRSGVTRQGAWTRHV